MRYRFVALSSQRLFEIPDSSPLKPYWMAAQSVSEDAEMARTGEANLLLVGLLLSHGDRGRYRQEPVFLRSGILGLYVPFNQEIHEYSGVYLYRAQNLANSVQVINTIRAFSENRSKDVLPTMVKFYSFDSNYAHSGHLDLVSNVISTEQTESMQYSSLFFISNLSFPHLSSFTEHFVGFLDLEGRKWPIFINSGYLCLKLDTLNSLLTDFAFWIDAHYRIRLGPYTADCKSRPVVHFTTLNIALPLCFEYASSSMTATVPFPVSPASSILVDLWTACAGVSVCATNSNTLTQLGKIPKFPVNEKSPNIVLQPWLPPFVGKIIGEAKKRAKEMVYSVSQAKKTDNESGKK